MSDLTPMPHPRAMPVTIYDAAGSARAYPITIYDTDGNEVRVSDQLAIAMADLEELVPTLEELETRVLLPTSISATTTVYLGPTNLAQRVGGASFSFSAAVAASDTNYWTVALQMVRANGTAVQLTALSTRSTGGVAIAALTDWTFDNVPWPSALRYLRKGDILRLVFTKTGTPDALADGAVAIRYEPNVQPVVRDSFTRNDADVLGTSDSGHPWSVYITSDGDTSKFAIRSNQAAIEQAAGLPRDVAVLNSGLADCSVSAKLLSVSTAGIAVRMAPATGPVSYNGYLNNGTAWFRADKGTLTSIFTFTSALANGDIFTVVMSGSTFSFYKNGVSIGSVSDATYTSTSHGLRATSPTLDAPLWDDFVVAA